MWRVSAWRDLDKRYTRTKFLFMTTDPRYATEQLNVRVTPAEKVVIEKLAANSGQTVSGFIRAIGKEPPKK